MYKIPPEGGGLLAAYGLLYFSFESEIRIYKMHASINQPRVCRDSAGHFIKMTGTYCTDNARVKVSLILQRNN